MTYKYGLTATTPIWCSTLRDSQSHEPMYRVIGFTQPTVEKMAREVAEEMADPEPLVIDESIVLELADMISPTEIDSQYNLTWYGNTVLEVQ